MANQPRDAVVSAACASVVASGSSQLRRTLRAIRERESRCSLAGDARQTRQRRRFVRRRPRADDSSSSTSSSSTRSRRVRDRKSIVSSLICISAGSSSSEVRRESRESIRAPPPRDLALPLRISEAVDRATPSLDLRQGEQKAPSPRRDEAGEDSRRARDYGQSPSQQKRSPLSEEVARRPEEDSLICKEHSLEYQSQTLESQSDHLFHEVITSSLEDLLDSVADSWGREVYGEEVEHSFKETQYSPKEKRDVQTQTIQESKSTQCSPDQSVSSLSEEPPRVSPFHVSQRYFQSPRREVQTQTQGEDKSVQCCLDDLGSLDRSWRADVTFVGSPTKSERESKSIQCVPEDIVKTPDRSRSSSRENLLRSPRREVEVQTCQESKAIQCSDDELLEAEQTSTDRPAADQSRTTSSTSKKTESSPSSSSSSPRKFPTVVFVEGKGDMTVTHREHDGDVAWSKHWGPERLVEIYREPKASLGLSIVGGKVRRKVLSSSRRYPRATSFITFRRFGEAEIARCPLSNTRVRATFSNFSPRSARPRAPPRERDREINARRGSDIKGREGGREKSRFFPPIYLYVYLWDYAVSTSIDAVGDPASRGNGGY